MALTTVAMALLRQPVALRRLALRLRRTVELRPMAAMVPTMVALLQVLLVQLLVRVQERQLARALVLVRVLHPFLASLAFPTLL